MSALFKFLEVYACVKVFVRCRLFLNNLEIILKTKAAYLWGIDMTLTKKWSNKAPSLLYFTLRSPQYVVTYLISLFNWLAEKFLLYLAKHYQLFSPRFFKILGFSHSLSIVHSRWSFTSEVKLKFNLGLFLFNLQAITLRIRKMFSNPKSRRCCAPFVRRSPITTTSTMEPCVALVAELFSGELIRWAQVEKCQRGKNRIDMDGTFWLRDAKWSEDSKQVP